MRFKTILSVLIIASCITISSVSAGWQPFISLYGKDLIQDSSEDYSSGDGNGSSSIYSLNQNYYEVQEKAVADTWNNGNSMQYFKYFYTFTMSATYYVVFGATLNGHIHEGSNNVGFQVYLAYQLCNGGCDWHQVLVYSVTGDQTFADVSKNFWGLQMGIQAWTTVTFRIGFYVYAWQNSIPWNTGYADFSGTNFIILQNFTVYQWQ